jgi:Neocarzinostatin family
MRNTGGGRWKWLLPLAIVVLIAAGCSDDSGDDSGGEDAATTTTAEAATTTSEAATTTTSGEFAAGEFDCADSVPECDGSITPAEGLADGDTVTIEASGFEPNLALGLTQCADENDPDQGIETTGADQCNLRAIGQVTSDADGRVSTTYAVAAGQNMIDNTAAGVTCDATHDCVVSVGELVPDPDAQRITFHVKFA